MCERVRGRWMAEVNADSGFIYGENKPSKLLIVEERNIKIWALREDGTLAGIGWTGWNTQMPTEEAGACVFTTRETIEGEGFRCKNPYAVVSKIRLKLGTDGIELTVTASDYAQVPCSPEDDDEDRACGTRGARKPKWVAKVNGWIKSLDGSYWKPAPANVGVKQPE